MSRKQNQPKRTAHSAKGSKSSTTHSPRALRGQKAARRIQAALEASSAPRLDAPAAPVAPATPELALPTPPAASHHPVKAQGVSCLDAAAQVLQDAGQPMRCQALIDAMAEKKLWISTAPTPAATLYSAITREITTKGEKSRFAKVERGLFKLNIA